MDTGQLTTALDRSVVDTVFVKKPGLGGFSPPNPISKHSMTWFAMSYIYSVYADFGVGEFLWRKNLGDTALLGGCLYAIDDYSAGDCIISRDLFYRLSLWAREYLDAHYADEVLEGFNWDRFNIEGLALAESVKVELPKDVGVQYVKAFDDPTHRQWRVMKIHR